MVLNAHMATRKGFFFCFWMSSWYWKISCVSEIILLFYTEFCCKWHCYVFQCIWLIYGGVSSPVSWIRCYRVKIYANKILALEKDAGKKNPLNPIDSVISHKQSKPNFVTPLCVFKWNLLPTPTRGFGRWHEVCKVHGDLRKSPGRIKASLLPPNPLRFLF